MSGCSSFLICLCSLGQVVVQHPKRARSCGFGEKDKRPVDPPPILQLYKERPDGVLERVRQVQVASQWFPKSPDVSCCSTAKPKTSRTLLSNATCIQLTRSISATLCIILHRLTPLIQTVRPPSCRFRNHCLSEIYWAQWYRTRISSWTLTTN